MKITELRIKNFRNIEDAVYLNVPLKGCFIGPNAQGKTNSLVAAYWCMCDIMLDGSSDFASMKPLSNKRATTEVEMLFEDGFSIRKTFREKWTTTRGSSEETLAGHETVYYLNGIKTPKKKKKKEIIAHFKVDTTGFKGKFDIMQAITNPYYFQQCDWKVLREFVIWLCGDVSDEDVIEADERLKPVVELLKNQYQLKTGKAKTALKQELKQMQQQASSLSSQIEGAKNAANRPTDEEVDAAKKRIREIDAQIDRLEHPDIQADMKQLNADRTAKEAEISEEKARIAGQKAANAAKQQEEFYSVNNKLMEVKEKIARFNNQKVLVGNLKENAQAQQETVKGKQARIAELESEIKGERARYMTLLDWKVPEYAKCPNCGYVNEETEKTLRAENQASLEECASRGKSLAENIQRMQLSLKEEQAKLERLNSQAFDAEQKLADPNEIEALRKTMDDLQAKVDSLRQVSEAGFETSEKLSKLNDELNFILGKIRFAKMEQSQAAGNNSSEIEALKKERAENETVVKNQAAWEVNAAFIERAKTEKTAALKKTASIEQLLAQLDWYIQKKLEVFKSRISSVFGEMGFQLVQENIKEGSWNEVCVPQVVGTDTPICDGSGSERIISGIHFIECVKKKLGLPDLPIIVDEADKLDSKHLAEIDTGSQILTTMVDDIHYTKVELIEIGGKI